MVFESFHVRSLLDDPWQNILWKYTQYTQICINTCIITRIIRQWCFIRWMFGLKKFFLPRPRWIIELIVVWCMIYACLYERMSPSIAYFHKQIIDWIKLFAMSFHEGYNNDHLVSIQYWIPILCFSYVEDAVQMTEWRVLNSIHVKVHNILFDFNLIVSLNNVIATQTIFYT